MTPVPPVGPAVTGLAGQSMPAGGCDGHAATAGPGFDSGTAAALAPLTDHPVQMGRLTVGTQQVTVWADRPARGLTRMLLTDAAGHDRGDAVLHGDTLTITLPGNWHGADRPAAACALARLVAEAGTDT